MINISIHNKMMAIIKRLSVLYVYMPSCSVISNSLQPHGLQPARLTCPWKFSGKNTGLDCHFLLKGIVPTRERTCVFCISCICFLVLVSQLCLTLCDPHELQPARLLHPQDFPGKNTGVGCYSLLQEIFQPRDQS